MKNERGHGNSITTKQSIYVMSFTDIQSAVAAHAQEFAKYLLAELGEECEEIEEYYEAFLAEEGNGTKKSTKKAPAKGKKKPVKEEEDSDDEEEKPKKKGAAKGGNKCLECGGGIRTPGEDYCSKHRKKASSAKKPTKKGKEDKPKKARSAYLIFSAEKREEVKEENPDMKSSEIMSELGRLWKELDDDEKEEWKEKAAEEKAEIEGVSRKKTPAKKSGKGKKKVEEDSDEEEEEKPKKGKGKKTPAKKSKKEVESEDEDEEVEEEEEDEW
jgi:hypothetical protein